MSDSKSVLLDLAGDRLGDQLEFILEIDRLKTILRQTVLTDSSRNENSAEHSWHLALMAIVLAEYSKEKVDLHRVLEMLLLHDIVEIDAGDTFCYDEAANTDKDEREQEAADRLFGLLPDEQGNRFRQLWEEFEARQTAEARFAAALDRLQPMLHNFVTNGHSWQEHGIRRAQVEQRNQPVEDGSPRLWSFTRDFLDRAVAMGVLEA